MGNTLHLDEAAEKEANDIGARFMHSSDVVGDMSRAYDRDLSSVRIHTDDSAARGAAERGVDAFSTGKDVFFARGAFDQNDPASRGLLAHELGHSMQQGVGGDGPALTQSAPMGAAQGGLLDMFRRLFGKSESAGESAQAAVPVAEAAAPETAAPAQEVGETDTQSDDPQQQLSSIAAALRTSSRVGLSDSGKFTRVSNAIDPALAKLRTPLTGNMAQDGPVLDEIIAAFQELYAACNDYIKRRNPYTERGKHRKDIVTQLKAFVEKDYFGFVRYRQTPDEGVHFTSAMDILTKSRQRTLQLKEGGEQDLQHVGGAASYIAKIDAGTLTDASVSGFFKEDETFTKFDSSKDMRPRLLTMLDKVQGRMNLKPDQYNALKATIKAGNSLRTVEGYYKSQTMHDAVNLIQQFSDGNATIEANMTNTILDSDQRLNLSKRNVATSRLADLLGIGDVVAKSETATLKDAGENGKERSGNLMQAAQGQEVASYVVDYYRDMYAEQKEKGVRSIDVSLTKKAQDRGANATDFDDLVTPEFLKSLTSLQVLDNLAAQGDRHSSNYFAQIQDGKLGKVQGIDNDFSFTTDTLDWEKDATRNDIGTYGRNILNANKQLILPFMDRSLANRIVALEENELRAFMEDVLEPWALDALCVRFGHIKKAIATELKARDTHRYLDAVEDWRNPEVLEKMKSLTDEYGVTHKRATNYVSNFMRSADLTRFDNTGTFDYRGFLDTDYNNSIVEAALKEVQDLNDNEKAVAKLKKYGVSEDVLSYLEATDQLLAGPALLKSLPSDELAKPILNSILAEKAAQRQQAKK